MDMLNLICENDARDLFSIMYGEGSACLKMYATEFKTCKNRATYKVLKILVIKLIEFENFGFKMETDDWQ